MSKTMILAIGGAGCNMAETIMRVANAHWVKEATYLFADSDMKSLSELGKKGFETLQILRDSDSFPTDKLKGVEKLYILAGLDGVTGSKFAEIAAKSAKSDGVRNVALIVTLPFVFEGTGKMAKACEALKSLSDIPVKVLNNEDLTERYPDLNFLNAFEYSDKEALNVMESVMKILHLSDTHNCHHRLRDLPEADMVVHSGDFCMVGSEQEALDFLNWFCDLPYKHKIFICGNHDDCLYGANIDGLDGNVHYLCNSGIEIDGVKFYGVPMFMGDCVTDRQSRHYANIPGDTDVLITHSPAYGILDYDDGINYGSAEILMKLSDLSLKAHLFGHIHAQHGIKGQNGVIFSNGAIMNADYTILSTPNIIIVENA